MDFNTTRDKSKSRQLFRPLWGLIDRFSQLVHIRGLSSKKYALRLRDLFWWRHISPPQNYYLGIHCICPRRDVRPPVAPLSHLWRGPQETGPCGVHRRTYTVPNACPDASLDHPQAFAVIEQQQQQQEVYKTHLMPDFNAGSSIALLFIRGNDVF